jgi:hypothetical protein
LNDAQPVVPAHRTAARTITVSRFVFIMFYIGPNGL